MVTETNVIHICVYLLNKVLSHLIQFRSSRLTSRAKPRPRTRSDWCGTRRRTRATTSAATSSTTTVRIDTARRTSRCRRRAPHTPCTTSRPTPSTTSWSRQCHREARERVRQSYKCARSSTVSIAFPMQYTSSSCLIVHHSKLNIVISTPAKLRPIPVHRI